MISFKFWLNSNDNTEFVPERPKRKTDDELVQELTAIVQSNHTKDRERGFAILNEIQDRLIPSPNEHPALLPVARVMAQLEPENIGNWLLTRDSLARQFGNPWSKLAL